MMSVGYESYPWICPWRAAKSLNDYFAGWEGVPSSPDSTREVPDLELDGFDLPNRQVCTIGTQTEEASEERKEGAPRRAQPLERAFLTGMMSPNAGASRAFGP